MDSRIMKKFIAVLILSMFVGGIIIAAIENNDVAIVVVGVICTGTILFGVMWSIKTLLND